MRKVGWFFLGICWMATGEAWAAKAKAEIRGTAPHSKISGTAHFEETAAGLSIWVEVESVPTGLHGFHIHEKGSCEEAGNAAGGHYNPLGAKHGFVPQDGFQGAHAGDFGNIEVNPEGKGILQLVIPELTIQDGKYNVAGRAVIVHEKSDDFGQPTGNAGGRIGCGVIEMSE